MKNIKKAAIVVLSIVATACAAAALAACDKVIELEELQKPKNVKLDSEVLTWDKVENADKYVLDFNGEEYTTTTESFDLFDKILTPAKYNVKIKAVGDEKKYYDSDWTGYGYTLSTTSFIAEENEDYVMLSIKNLDTFRGKAIIPPIYKKKPVRFNLSAAKEVEKYTGLTSLYIEDGVRLSVSGLSKFVNLSRIKLPSGFDLNVSMFQNCAKLKSLDIPSGVESIYSNSFSGCTSLEKLSIPDTVAKIATNVIVDCDNLKEVTVAEENEVYKSIDNCVISKDDSSLVFNAPNSPIAEGVKILAYSSVYSNQSELKIPASVTEIAASAFSNLKIVPTVQIDANNQTFKCQGNCIIKKADNTYVKAFPNSVLPSDLTVIPESLFSYEKFLTEYTVPSTVTEIGANAFRSCSNLTNVKFHDGVTKIGDSAFKFSGLENLYLPSNIKEIGAEAFNGCKFTSAILPESIEKIGEDAFGSNNELNFGIRATLYTSLEKLPEGIHDYLIGTKAIFFSCEIASGDKPYVVSFTYKKNSLSGYNGYIPVREGYKFLGWTTEKNGTTAEYGTYDEKNNPNIFDGTQTKTGRVYSLPTGDLVAINLGSMINDEQTNYVLYAVWKATK